MTTEKQPGEGVRKRDTKRKAVKYIHLRAVETRRLMWRCRAAESEQMKLYSHRAGYRERKGEGGIREKSTDARKESTGQGREGGSQTGRKGGIWRDWLMSNLIEKRIYLQKITQI